MKSRFKMKICTIDNEPIIKAKADNIEDFEPVFTKLKKKFGGR